MFLCLYLCLYLYSSSVCASLCIIFIYYLEDLCFCACEPIAIIFSYWGLSISAVCGYQYQQLGIFICCFADFMGGSMYVLDFSLIFYLETDMMWKDM